MQIVAMRASNNNVNAGVFLSTFIFLRQNINIFPKNFNINVIPCLLQLKPEAFRECRIDLVSLIVPLTPNLLDGMKVDGTSSVFPSVTGNSKNR